jgi:hypothetical protein
VADLKVGYARASAPISARSVNTGIIARLYSALA